MSDWVGFTEADIRRMEHSETPNDQRPKIVKPVATGSKRNPQQSAKRSSLGKQQGNQRKISSSTNNNVPAGARLTKPVQHTNTKQNNIENKKEIMQVAPKDNDNIKQITPTTEILPSETKMEDEPKIIIDEEAIKKKEKIKLEDVHLRQKQMEERNKRKRAMLTKEIAERKKKASAESHKLIRIQAELTKLDQMLNCDVSILRDKIEEACWNFMNAQKRFQKAEAEYISAKMDLHEKTEKKEDLTQHLFNLIQANEERKAKKLEELMFKLNVEEEELEAREEKEKLESEKLKLQEEKRKSEQENKTKINEEKNQATVNNEEDSAKAEDTKLQPTTENTGEGLHGETKEGQDS